MKKYGKNFKKNYVKGWGFRTICEVLREIFWQTDDEGIRDKVMEATVMAKKMDSKLRAHGGHWDDDMWEEIDNAEEIKLQRMKQFIKEQKAKK